MYQKMKYALVLSLLLSAALFMTGCGSFLQPVKVVGTAPTPVVLVEEGGVDNPDVYVDEAEFQAALLGAVAKQDTEKLQKWMTGSFLTGTWRLGLPEKTPADALEMLYANQLGEQSNLEPVKGADLAALMGVDPLSLPRQAAGVTGTILVKGWGKDGQDEAVLFVARQADNSLKWIGWLQFLGGISGARVGGIEPVTNEAHGYSLYLPKGFLVAAPEPGYSVFSGPAADFAPRGLAYVYVEPANGRSAEQAVQAVKDELGSGFNLSLDMTLDIEGAQALVILGIPGQDSNIQVFMVHGDLLYKLVFTPDDPQAGDAYRQMQDAYAMVINTFHFIK